ncbi:MAG: hypothetical protein HY306_11205 [Nitrosomonadales bacterium]|nr:hypothetical protein [Nitrosomonadales bacterium]
MALCCELQLADDLHLRNESTLLVGVALAEYRCFAEIANALDALAQNRNLSFGLASMRMRSHIELNEISAASQIFRQLSDMARTAGEIGILVKAAPCIFECAALYHELGKLLSALERIAPPSALPLDAAIVRAGILLSLGNRAGFMNLVSQTRGMDPAAHEELDLMQQMAARLEAHQASGAATAKIFCIGLSKTATTSLNKALGLLGYLSAHWANPITGKLLDDEDIPLFDSLGDTPVSYRFEELYHSYPNARFIYSQRDPAPWEKSVTKHYAASHRDRQAQNFATLSRFNHHAQEISYGERARRLNNCVYFNDRSFVDAYRNFDRRVRRFFEDKPASCFLEVDIFSGDGWNMLCPFLEKPIPDTPFPWEYQTRLIIEGKS